MHPWKEADGVDAEEAQFVSEWSSVHPPRDQTHVETLML